MDKNFIKANCKRLRRKDIRHFHTPIISITNTNVLESDIAEFQSRWNNFMKGLNHPSAVILNSETVQISSIKILRIVKFSKHVREHIKLAITAAVEDAKQTEYALGYKAGFDAALYVEDGLE